MITVYTKPSCVQCDATKRHLTKLNLEFNSVDITTDERAYSMVLDMGFQSAPVVVTEDDAWAGYQPEKIDKLVA